MKHKTLFNSLLILVLVLANVLTISSLTVTAQQPSDEFVEFQSIPTNSGTDWEFFTIGSDAYLAVANHHNDSTHNIDSKIYRWNGTSFAEFQSIPTIGATAWEFFTIGSDHYLVVANHTNGSTTSTNSKIYKWNGTSFVEFQSIPTIGASDWEFFTIGSDAYLAVANTAFPSYNVDTKIYKWNGTSFAEFQSIPTNGATDWKFFTIGSDAYLAVANYLNGSTTNIDSKIYKWNGISFAELQAIPTNGAFDWEFFTIGSDVYLAVANNYNYSTTNINSKIYKWNGTSFAEFQSIPTNGAWDWEFFTIGSDAYLAVANHRNDSAYNIDSKIYKWNEVSFVDFQSIPTSGSRDWEFFTIGSDAYLAVGNHYDGSTSNIDSKIYKVPLIPVDTTPPVITSNVSGSLGNDGWHIGDVTVSWTVTDPESGIASSAGCDPTTLTTDTAGTSLTCSATNGAGLSNSESITVKLDKTAPALSITNPEPYDVEPVGTALGFSASDALSGLEADAAATLTGEAGTWEMASGEQPGMGVYEVVVEATDRAGNTATSEPRLLVIYDPEGGFVTGGGWIYSDPGAYVPDPTLEGKANFGFVSKYKKGATVPTGQTEFQFRVADLNFHSSSYNWLVVTGSDYAKFKGSGTINGMGDYKFMLWAGDGDLDTFRIRIWEEDEDGNETVTYDNGFDQEIGGGSIVIHTSKK